MLQVDAVLKFNVEAGAWGVSRMAITEQQLDQVYSDLKANVVGCKEDFFSLLYLEKEFDVPRDDAMVQIAFGGNDYGLDAFHLDPKRRNLYLFQFKWSPSHALFKGSMERLRDAGLERIFGNAKQDQYKNQLLLQLDSRLQNDKELVDRVLIHFVFNGDPAEAENSKALESLREDLENKKFLLDQFFKRQVELLIEFRSAKTKKVSSLVHQKTTHAYPISMSQTIQRKGPEDVSMHIGFVRLVDLHGMYRAMNQRFFERNIRSALGSGEAPNRAILQSLKRIVLDCKEEPSVFAFNHNGVTIYAQNLESQDGENFKITEPRLLNGAQTISTFAEFLKKNENNALLKQNDDRLCGVSVLAKIITNAKPEFVLSVTINNNRQNPVEPWSLHANDMIQLEMQDFFHQELSIYYERQENAFSNLTMEDLDELEIEEKKAIELLKLAKTYLASDGKLDRFSRIREVFEQDKSYDEVFNKGRLLADAREIMLL